jgi:phosphatidylserine/phosphatidylglycerophosphate/cardiolipin synthase-like enzyme
MVDFAEGKIQAFVGPVELGAADNLEEVIIDFINGAEKSLDIAVQEIDSEKIAQAIIDAKWRDIDVRVVVEHDYICNKDFPEGLAKPLESDTEEEALRRAQWEELRDPEYIKTNRDIHAALLRNGIDIKADYNLGHFFHQKFIVRDPRKNKALPKTGVLTGSTNFTWTGTHKNLNNVVIFNDRKITWQYKEEFEEVRSGVFGGIGSRHEKKADTVNLAGVPVQVLFAPDHAPELEIMKQILKCKNQMRFAIFTFTGSSGIDDAMTAIHKSGKSIRGVMDPGQGAHFWAATPWLHDAGIELFFPRYSPKFGKLHHKLTVVDEDIVVAGSMNYTVPANEFNDENIFIIGSPYNLGDNEGGPVNHDACNEIAEFFNTEIERIITDLSDPYTE